MNKSFHSIWNASKQAYVAADETVSAKGKPSSGVKVAAVLAGLMGSLLGQVANAQNAPPPNTLPTGDQISAGQASISANGAHMVINQSSNRAAINWQTFNVGKDAHVQFQQPNANSVTFNRVLSNDPSQIFGRITSNGQVILTNPAGVYFGASARVDVGGLIATTHGMNDADFMAGKNRFERNGGTGSVVNEGELKAALGGYIALLAPEVRNQGAVIAQMGTVALASGEAIELKFDSNNRLTSLRVDPSQIQALVDNQQAVKAPGGLVIISAQSMDRLVGGVVKNSGVIEATGMQSVSGRIVLSASNQLAHGGTLDVSSTAAQGGLVSLQGANIALQNDSRINASGTTGGGTVLVGGNWQGKQDPLLLVTEQPSQAAITVTMDSNARIDANATQQGHGGTVVLWSDVGNTASVTNAHGQINASASGVGGDGGQVETSGYQLNTDGIAVRAGSSGGKGGLWLLDPSDSTINASAVNSYLTSLNNGTNVINFTSGTITWATGAHLVKNAGGVATLTVRAGTNLTIQDGINITSTSGALNLVLWSGYASSSSSTSRGWTSIGSANINTNGGHVWVGGGTSSETTTWNGLTVGTNYATVMADTTTNGGVGLKLTSTTINTSGGNIYLKGRTGRDTFGAQIQSANINSGNGSLRIDAVNYSAEAAGLSLEGTTTLSGTGNLIFDVNTPETSPSTSIRTDSRLSLNRGARDVTIVANNLSSASFNVATTGHLVVQPYNASFRTALSLSALGISATPSSLTIGKSGNTAGITVDAATSVAGPITLYGGNIAINAGLTATGTNTITLQGSGATTDGASGFVNASNLLLSGSGSVTLDNSTSNNVGTLAASGGGALTYLNSAALTLGTVGATSGVSATGTVNIGTKTGDLTVAQNVSTTNASASALTLNAGIDAAAGTSTGSNLIRSGNPTITVGTGGIGKLFTGSISGSTGLTGLSNLAIGSGRFRYNSDETNTRFTTALTAGLNAIYREQPTASTNSLLLSMVYGDALPGITGTGTVNGDTAGFNITSRLNSTSGNIRASGTPYVITENLTGLGYLVNGSSAASTGTLTVAAKALTMSGLSVPTSKIYNGSTSATVSGTSTLLSAQASGSGTSLDGRRYTNDVVSITGTAAGTYNSKDVANANSVTFSGLSLTGTDAGNYSLTIQSPASATITAKALTIAAPSIASKVYDASTASGSLTLGSLSGRVGSETLSVSGTAAALSSANVGNYSTTVSYTLANAGSGATAGLASNYSLAATTGVAASITAKALTISAPSIASKVYDATTAAGALTLGTLSGLVGTETLGVTGSAASLASANVGSYSTTVSYTLSNAGAGVTTGLANNYSLSATSGVATSITQKALTMSGLTVPTSKVYDGTTSASVGGTATLQAAQAPGAGTTADGKPYTGGAVAITGTAVGTYNSKDVSNASTVTFSGLSLTNSNYSLTMQSPASATITAKALTISGLSSQNKVYDGTTNATVMGTAALQSAIAAGSGTSSDGKAYIGDSVALTGAAAGTFNSKDVVSANQVAFTGLSLSETLAGNYTLIPHAVNTTARITAAPLTVSVNDDGKFIVEADRAGFNGVSFSGFVNGETPSALGGTAVVSRSNAGTNASGVYTGVLTATGLSSSNYALTYLPGTFTITPANQLLVELANASTTYGTATQYAINSVKYYNDPTNDGIVNGTVYTLGSGGVSGSSVSINNSNLVSINDGAGGTATFTLTPISSVLSQANKLSVGRYQLGVSGSVTNNSQNFNNTITVTGTHQVNTKGLTASASQVSKPYDGNTGMTGVVLNLSTLETNDVVTVNGVGTFSDKNVGTGLSYTLSNLTLDGVGASNYHFAGGGSFSGSNGVITAAPLTITANNANKTYDGSAYSGGNGVNYSGLVSGETASVLGGSLSFGGTSQGAINANAYAIVPSGLTSSNYAISYANGTLNIAKANATVTANSATSTYNGTNQTVSGFTVNGLVNNETAAVLTGVSASRTEKNAGTYSVTASGTDTNYNLTFVDGSMVINQAPLTITANNASKTYGSANPTLSSTISGFVNGETLVSSGVTGSATAVTTATNSTGAGSATISAGMGNLAASNYSFGTLVDGTLSIEKAPLTVAANNASKTYGDPNPTLSATISGFVNGETLATSGVTGAATVTTTATTLTGASSVPITAGVGDLAANNYSFSTPMDGTLTINKANATVTANSATSTYNGANQTVSGFTVNGLVNNETAAVLAGVSASRTEKNAGTYSVTASGTDANYNLTFVDGSMVINQAPLTITASNASKTYDGTAYSGGNGVSYSGLVGGETASVLGGSLSYGGTSQGATNAGTGYTIVPSGLSSTNYAITYTNGTLDINPASVTVTTINGALQGSVSKVYDGDPVATLSPANYALTGWLGSDGATVTKISGTYDNANVGNGKTVTVSLSTSDYSATGGTNLSNYSLPTSINGAVGSISRAPLTVTASNASKTYDGTAYSGGNGVSYSGLVGGETASVLGGSLSYGGTSQGATNAGTGYTIVPSGLSSTNYAISYNNGTLNIAKANATVTANSATSTYNGANQTVSGFTVNGLVNNETAAVLTGVSASRTEKNAGTYLVTAGGTDANYNLTFVDGTMTIQPAPLTISGITAANKAYDGTSEAVISTAGVTSAVLQTGGLVAGDEVRVHAIGNFRNANNTANDPSVGKDKLVVLVSSYSGNDVGNYAITDQATTTATIQNPQREINQIMAAAQSSLPFYPQTTTVSAISPPLLTTVNTAVSSSSSKSGGDASAQGLNSSGIVIDLRQPEENGSSTFMMAAVSLPKGTATVGTGFSFELPDDVRALSKDSTTIQASLTNGSPLPAWISFEPASLRFQANAVPDGAFPLEVRLDVGGQRVLVVISERGE